VAPYKFDPTRQEIYLGHLRNGHSKTVAAGVIGMTPQAIHAHAKKHEDFAKLERTAYTEGTQIIERRLLDAGREDRWLLANRHPEEYAEKQKIEHEGGIQIILAPHPDMMDDDPEAQ
jgi:hypothetical protein